MPQRKVQWGGLTVRIIEPSPPQAADLNIVLCHGYGAPGTDLVPLAAMLQQSVSSLSQRARFLFPEAPLDLGELGLPGGRAWWHLDILRLQQAVATGQYRDFPNEMPDGLPAAREALLQMLKQCADETRVPMSRTVLGGFSQGAMLSSDVAWHLPESPAGLVILSGSLINWPAWEQRLKQCHGIPVFLSHGEHDPLLPYDLAVRLRDELQSAGNTVTFCGFAGSHEIPLNALTELGRFLDNIVAS
jgi:phospholipase/carboxylesterase